MRFLPVGIELFDRPCTVVGGGAVGTRKALKLLRAGAAVTVVAPEVTEELARQAEAGRLRWVKEGFREEHLEGVFLVVLATDDAALNAAAARLAAERRILFNLASSAFDSQVIFGALLEQGEVTVAAFTDGRDPARAKRVRDEIAALFAPRRPVRSPESAAAAAAGIAGTRRSVLVLVAHGSRDPGWKVPLEELAASVADEVAGGAVRLAYSQFSSPTLEDVVGKAAASGVGRIRVLPLFMTNEGHVERDIRPVLESLRLAHPDLELELLEAVGRHAPFRRLLVDIAREEP